LSTGSAQVRRPAFPCFAEERRAIRLKPRICKSSQNREQEAQVGNQSRTDGLGAIGRGIARCALQKPDLEIVAAIDLDPKRVGKKLSDVVDAPCPEVIIGSDAAAEMKKAQGGVLLHATGSRLDRVEESWRRRSLRVSA